jgi:hypothetical protein
MVSRGEGESEGESEGVNSIGTALRRSSMRPGAQRQAGGGVARLGARALSYLCLLAEVDDDWQGPGGLGRPGKWPRYSALSLSLFYISFCFSISVSVFDLVKILSHFLKS